MTDGRDAGLFQRRRIADARQHQQLRAAEALPTRSPRRRAHLFSDPTWNSAPTARLPSK